MSKSDRKTLYAAEWREIVVINFEIDPKLLRNFIPPKTELDFFNETSFVTLMARACKNVKPYGWPIVFAKSIDQILLRFYVKRKVGDTWRRGVCLIRDYLPKRKASFFLNWMFKHSFTQVPIKRTSSNFESGLPTQLPTVEYQWTTGDYVNHIKVNARSQMRQQEQETKESFVLDHHYGYTVKEGKTYEYYVEYSPWAMWDAQSGSFDCDTENVFGRPFVRALKQRPASVFLARGSDVIIYRPTEI